MSFLARNLQYLIHDHYAGYEQVAADVHINVDRCRAICEYNEEATADELIAFSKKFHITIDRLLKVDIALKNRVIKDMTLKLLVFDVDGVMTDGAMFYSESGDEFKKFNTKDGLAIRKLAKQENPPALGIISSGYNFKLINKRAKLLGISYVYTGTKPKIDILKNWCEELNIALSEVGFIGDDINDLDCMNRVGISACPSDAVDRVKQIADIVLLHQGGHGCIREFIDEYLQINLPKA